MDFNLAFDRLLGNEGGYTNNPADPGGETNWGITWPVLRQATGEGIVSPGTTIATLTRDQAKAIYSTYFWNPIGDAQPAIKFQVFDFAVNSGIQTAIRKLQAAIGVADDGHWGPVSAAKLDSLDINDVLMRFMAQRLRYWVKCSAWQAMGGGWANRAAKQLEYASEDN
jgi:lysozyme family protein